MNSGPLSREEIARLIGSGNPLIEDFLSFESQLQPNGFDLSLLEVAKFEGRGQTGSIGC